LKSVEFDVMTFCFLAHDDGLLAPRRVHRRFVLDLISVNDLKRVVIKHD